MASDFSDFFVFTVQENLSIICFIFWSLTGWQSISRLVKVAQKKGSGW